MVNSKEFGLRIQKIMNHYAISAASFADHMGVGRSSISHILSGRNKPSLDFVMKITEAYSDVNLQWLLYGIGTFPSTPIKQVKDESYSENQSKDERKILKDPLASFSNANQDLFSDTTVHSIPEDIQEKKINNMIQGQEMKEGLIERIVVFYANGSFKSYQSKNS